MKIIHQNGYSSDELMLYRLTVLKNLLDSAQALVLALRKFMLEPELSENRVSGRSRCRVGIRRALRLMTTLAIQENTEMILLARIDADPNFSMEPEMAKAIESLWHDPVMPRVMERSSEFYLMDSAP